ncbi:hypothetical protein Lser_V15G03260 [Lactuca serriola]
MEGLSERQTPSSSTSGDIGIPEPTSTSISQSSTSADIGENIKKSARWQNHENIIPFIVYCHKGSERIMVSEYADNYSLQDYLQDPEKRRSLNWEKRLKICLGAARGLEYLHWGLGEGRVLIHRNFKSSNILLDDNLEAKLCGLCFSKFLERNQPQVCKPLRGMQYYLDPIYEESGILTMESDIYSLGVVMFEMLTGMLANDEKSIGEDPPQALINLVKHHFDYGLDKLIDPDIKDQIKNDSFYGFQEVAYQCIGMDFKHFLTEWIITKKNRPRFLPTMKKVIDGIEGAMYLQTRAESQNHHRAALTVSLQSHEYENRERFIIPLEEIKLATRNFIGRTRSSGSPNSAVVYRGRLSERWQHCEAAFKVSGSWDKNKTSFIHIDPDSETQRQQEQKFRNELEMMSGFNNENIIRFIGYCDEDNKLIMVSEYAINGNLDQHLQDTNMRRSLTWAQRLKICIGTARGLDYLHSGLEEGRVVIHRNIKSSKILLDDNWEAKICGFGFSTSLDRNQGLVDEHLSGIKYYLDHISKRSHVMTMESDIYSFGVVLFEILSGMLAYNEKTTGNDLSQTLMSLVRFNDGLPDELIDPNIRYQTTIHSLHAFEELAYQCISLNVEDRPTMKMIIKRLQDIQNNGQASTITTNSLESFLIPLTEIKLATHDFSPETKKGSGGFGVVYKGTLSKRWENCTVAIKRLNPNGPQGKNEFLTELKFISNLHHPNIIRFVGYCDEGNEMIIVNKYASNGSLDDHLEDPNKRSCLKWEQRLKICLGAAKGLDYLHSGLGKDKRVIHRDVKSGNILLDKNFEAKICDFGLSRQSPRNQQHTQLFTKAAGTFFYLDPAYLESGILRKESDVYSFGIVLFEMMSGILAYHKMSFGDGNKQPLIELVRYYYNNEPDYLIDPLIRDQIDRRSFDTLNKLAYECINLNLEQRPTMDAIIDSIEDAIGFQVEWRRNRKASRADSPFNLKKALHELGKEKVRMSSDYVEFYSYAFRYCLTEEKQRYVDIESICELLELVLGSQFPCQVNLFIRYLKTENRYKVINMDQWMGFYRFCNEISSTDFNNYDKDHAWPLILDNFVEWVRSTRARLQRNALRQTESSIGLRAQLI